MSDRNKTNYGKRGCTQRAVQVEGADPPPPKYDVCMMNGVFPHEMRCSAQGPVAEPQKQLLQVISVIVL